MASNNQTLERYCLVTVGATVGFKELTDSVIDASFWDYLNQQAFTHLRVQCGPDIAWAAKKLDSLQELLPSSLSVEVFEMRKNLLKEEMMLCKAEQGVRAAGVVISHAGTGTILDAWKLGLSLIVVPNTSLLDDHQTEMAKHLSKKGYATMSTSSSKDLQAAIDKAEILVETNKKRWPAHEIPAQSKSALRLWQISPLEDAREEQLQISHD